MNTNTRFGKDKVRLNEEIFAAAARLLAAKSGALHCEAAA